MRALPAILSHLPRILVVLILVAATSPAEEQATEAPSVLTALTGGRVVTLDAEGTLDSATVLIRDGRIEAIGSDVEIPEDAQRIDVSGMTVIPGLIDCRSSLWLDAGSVRATAGDCSLSPLDAVDLFSTDWLEVARGGVTAVSVQPSGSLGGTTAVLRVAPADSVEDLVIHAPAAIQASLGLTGNTNTSRDRYAQYESLKKSLDAAKKYQEEWKKYNEALAKKKKKAAASGDEGEESTSDEPEQADRRNTEQKRPVRSRSGTRGRDGQRSETRRARPGNDEGKPQDDADKSKGSNAEVEVPKKPKKDPGKELLVRLLEKELPLRFEVHRADDAANALALADEFEVDVILEGCSDVGRTWSTISSERLPLIIGPLTVLEATPGWLNRGSDRYENLVENQNLLAIASFSRIGRGSRLLRLHGAAAVAEGIAKDRALRAMTIDAARILGIADDTGSLRAGKAADIAVVAGDPLNPAAPVTLTLSQGIVTYRRTSEHAAPTFAAADPDATDAPALPDAMPAHYELVSQHVLRPDGSLKPGVVVVKDGVISEVRDAATASGENVFDLGAAVITPGLVAAHVPVNGNLSAAAVRGHLSAVDQFDPDDQRLHRLAEQGVTAAVMAPDSAGVVAGRCGVVRVAAADPLTVGGVGNADSSAAVKFVLSSASRDSQRFPSSLSGQLQLLNRYFDGQDQASSVYLPVSVRDLIHQQNETMRTGLSDGDLSAVLEARTAGEVEVALRLVESRGLKAALLGASDLRGLQERLAAAGTGLIIDPATAADYDWRLSDVVDASQRGVPVAVSGPDPMAIRNTVALLVAAGMPTEAGYRALTTDAARLGGAASAGQLRPQAAADIVIWEGDPLDPATSPVQILVDGQPVREQL